MRYCVSQNEMQAIEKYTVEQTGIPSLVLMERAALATTEHIVKWISNNRIVWVVCGVGNNGADGLAIARMLHLRGYHVTIVCIGNVQKKTQEYVVQENIVKNLQIPMISWQLWNPSPYDCMVDAMFGIGLVREIKDEFYETIEKWKQVPYTTTISVDIPSGISATTGEVLGIAVEANYTVTFGYPKIGAYLGRGRVYCGALQVVDIGLDPNAIQVVGCMAKLVEEKDTKTIPERNICGNKGDYGKLLMVVGSNGMCGAAYLSALAAYRTGAGLVKVLTVEANRSILQTQLPEAILEVYDPNEKAWLQQIETACNWASVIVMGPGIGAEPYVVSLVKAVTQNVKVRKIPTILDADALNIIARNLQFQELLGSHVIITPHIKEMSRLLEVDVEALKKNPIQYAGEYSKMYGVTCILKDAVSVITNNKGQVILNISGSAALAKAGSGDVLAGIVGGLCCIGISDINAASYGAYLHGKAGTECGNTLGKHQVLARDIIEYIHWNQGNGNNIG